MGSNLGTLTLDLIAKTGGFTGPLNKAERHASKNAKQIAREQAKLRKQMHETIKTAIKWGTGIAIGATTAAVAMVKSSLKAADTIGKVAATAGVTTDTLQEMRHAASLSGIEFNDLDKGMQAFNKRLGELKAGTGALYTYLNKTDEALLSQLKTTRSTDDALNMMFAAMSKVTDESKRAALAASGFGRSGQRLVILTKDYERLRKEAIELGLVIDADLIKNAEAANDKLDTMSRIISTRMTGAILELAPTIQKMTDSLIELTPALDWFLSGKDSVEALMDAKKASEERKKQIKDVQDLLALQKEWRNVEQTQLALKAQKGSLFDPDTLEQARNNIETIRDEIKSILGVATTPTPPPTKSTKKTGLESMSEDQLENYAKSIEKEIKDIETAAKYIDEIESGLTQSISDNYDSRIAATIDYAERMKANEYYSEDSLLGRSKEYNEKEKQRLEALRQMTEESDVAILNAKYEGIELEIELHKYKFTKLKELYKEGSEERKQIERLEAAEAIAIEKEKAQKIFEIRRGIITDSENMFAELAIAAKNFGHDQTVLYRVMFAASQSFRVAEATANMFQAMSNAGANAKTPLQMAADMALVGARMATLIGAVSAVGMADDGIDRVPISGTWLLKKGERVTTEKTSAKLDNTLDNIRNNKSQMNVNIYEARGTSTQVTQRSDGTLDIKIELIEDKLVQRMNRGTGLSSFLDNRYGRHH